MVKFIRKLNLWVILFTLLAYLAPYVSPYQMSFLMFVGVAFPWLLVVNMIFVVLWALSRIRYWWYSAAVILVGWTHLTNIFGVNYWKTNPAEALDSTSLIRVMTYNVHGCIAPNTKSTVASRLELSRYLEQKSPDVLCLQEFILQWKADVDKQMLDDIPFLKTYPYWIRLEGNDLAIFSRYPILDSGTLLNRNNSNGCTYADISVQNQTLRFYSLQLHSNIVSDIADNLAKNKDLIDDESWFSVGRMLTRFRRNGMIRARDAETVKKHIKESPYPVILCGDFNDIPVSYSYRMLSEGFTDAFQETGQGIGTTYAGHIPALRIDYILTDPSFKPLNCTIQRVRYSDHYPVISDIKIQ
jgi:endonuclease/exonuclease/phosphatase family metal-dependent hydrolase